MLTVRFPIYLYSKIVILSVFPNMSPSVERDYRYKRTFPIPCYCGVLKSVAILFPAHLTEREQANTLLRKLLSASVGLLNFCNIVGTWTYSCLTPAYEEHAIILRSWRGHVNSPHRLRTTNVFSLTRRQTLEAIMDSLSPSCRRFVEFWTRRFCSCVMCAISRGRW